ncbi:hypothetical protein ACOME3_005198 [Neoechinorhynchus agilis]
MKQLTYADKDRSVPIANRRVLQSYIDCLNLNEEWGYDLCDVFDVWFDSGCSFHASGIDKADVYCEGLDQINGWFLSSLVLSVGLNEGKSPFRKLMVHGFVVDESGKKMAKSKGNVIDPDDIFLDK